MAVSDELGERRTVRVPAGTLEYRERGSGPPVLLVHGAAVNGDLWRKVVPELAGEHRCIALDVPLGGHSIALTVSPTCRCSAWRGSLPISSRRSTSRT